MENTIDDSALREFDASATPVGFAQQSTRLRTRDLGFVRPAGADTATVVPSGDVELLPPAARDRACAHAADIASDTDAAGAAERAGDRS